MEKMQRLLSKDFLKGNSSINVRREKYRKSAELHSHEFYEVERESSLKTAKNTNTKGAAYG